jgi:hypothetical protein
MTNITRKLHTTVALAAVTVGLAAAPAAMAGPASAGTISNGPVKPTVVWDHAAWKKCWAGTYAQWRQAGSSPGVSQNAADLTCGTQP